MSKSTFKFEEGTIMHLVSPMGKRENSDGDEALSQRGEVYGTSVPWVFVGFNEHKKPLVSSPDGELLVTHRSHFDPLDKYNVGKGGTTRGADKLAMLESRREALTKSLKQVDSAIESELEHLEAIEIAKEAAREIQAAAKAAMEAETETGPDEENAEAV